MLRTLTRKFSISVAVFVALIALLAINATRVAWQNIALGKRMTGETMILVTATDHFGIEMSRAIAKTRAFGYSFRPADRDAAVQALAAAESWMSKLNELATTADAAPSADQTTRRDLLQRQQAMFDRGDQSIRAALPVLISNSPRERGDAFERLQQFESEWEALMAEADNVVKHEIASASAALTERNQGNLVLMPVSFAFVGLAAVLSLLALRRWVIRPIGALSAATTAFGAGKHELSVAVTNDDEIGDLQRAFNQMAANVRENRAAIEQRSAELESSLAAQQQLLDTVKQLSTPLLPVMDGVVILPIVGHIDTQRADHIMHTLLHGVAARRARVAILDLTGIAMLDTHVLALLMQAVRATELLGARVLLAGFSAAMAQVIVEQGVTLGEIHSYRDLASALEAAATDVQRNNLRYGFGAAIN